MKRKFSTSLQKLVAAVARWAIAAFLVVPAFAGDKNYGPGVTDTEIKIGQTMPYSGPLSALGAIGRVEAAYFRMVNEKGGINGRKITLISLDDGYQPPKTVEAVCRLVEVENVAFIANSNGIPTNVAVRKYLNDHHVPHLFLLAPSEEFNDPEHFPWSMGLTPTFFINGQMVAKYILDHKPNAKIGVLYQNDSSGKDHLRGIREGLGARADTMIVKALSYEASDPTIDSQVVEIQGAGADTFYNAASLKFATLAIRKSYEIGWRPLQFMAYASSSIDAVLRPAGLEKAKGIITGNYTKDAMDPQWQDDPEVKELKAFFEHNSTGGSIDDSLARAGYIDASMLAEFIRRCGDDLTREAIMRQATNIHDMHMPLLLKGISINTSPTSYLPIKQLVPVRFNGERWEFVD